MKAKVVILCGGEGLRMRPLTADRPKALQLLDGVPIIRHIMNAFASAGFNDFILAAGYQAERIREFVDELPKELTVTIVDSGPFALSGTRVRECLPLIESTTIVSYSDGLANIEWGKLLQTHLSRSRLATLAVVPMPSQYGVVTLSDDDAITDFQEKPVLTNIWISAGFMVFERVALERDFDELERGLLTALASEGELGAFRHQGYWRAIDTITDLEAANRDALNGARPWLVTHKS